jgi:flagellar biosynthesis protein FlhA
MVLGNDDDPITGGKQTIEPVFGLPASWVPDAIADYHRSRGATVVDPSSVIVTHLAEIVRRNAASLLSRQDVQRLIDGMRPFAPVLADAVGPTGLSLAEVHDVLRGLLAESVPIRDLVRILEAITAKSRESRDIETLVESARQALAPAICNQHSVQNILTAITFDPRLEHVLLQSRRMGESGWVLDLDGTRMEQLLRGAGEAIARSQKRTKRPVVLCAPPLRPIVRRLVGNAPATPPVISYAEIVPSVTVEFLEVIDLVGADSNI